MPDLTGGCLCGGVRFRITAPLGTSNYCHCTRCQRRTGTGASANARVPDGAFVVEQGEALLKGYRPPDGMEKVFCTECGSALFSRVPGSDYEGIGVRLGTIDGDPGVRPEMHTRVATAAVWEPLPDDGLPRHPGGKPRD